MVDIKKEIKKLIPFSESTLLYFLALLFMPIINLIIVVNYPSFKIPIILFFLFALIVVLQKIRKYREIFTSIFIMYLVAISMMTEYASPWTIPIFTAYVVHLADNVHKFSEDENHKNEKKKKITLKSSFLHMISMKPPKSFKNQNWFFFGVFISTLISIVVAIWSEYLIRFFDTLPHTEPFRTYITVGAGAPLILFLLWIMWKLATREY